MIGFWIAALAMLAVALALVVPPLAAAPGRRGPTRADVRRAVYREQLNELEAQRDTGSLDAQAFVEARAELDRAFLDEQRDDTVDAGEPRSHPLRAAVVAVLVPAVAAGAYLAVGTPGALRDGAREGTPRAAPGAAQLPPIEEMVAGLEQRLEREPGDAEGWVMLARSYQMMQRPDDAQRVLERALAHHPDDPVVLVHLAEATASNSGNRLDGAPMDYVRRALALAPDFPRALWLAGIHASNQGDARGALAHWEQVLRVADLAPGARAQIEQAVADARARAGRDAPAGAAAAPAPGPVSIEVTVTLADALAPRVDGGETLFVFAKAVDGPPMPLAVARLSAGALPATVVLDDGSAMAPQLRLSQFETVTVTARISRAGEPTRRSGDLEGVSAALEPAAHAKVSVVIDRVVE